MYIHILTYMYIYMYIYICTCVYMYICTLTKNPHQGNQHENKCDCKRIAEFLSILETILNF